MFSNIDDITIDYEDEGVQTVKQIDKIVLTRGAWTTILFRYQDWDNRKQAYTGDKYSIRRYQKRNGEYRQKSKFNISSREQAQSIINHLTDWLALPEESVE